jgi:hypothetical protein
VKFSKGRKPKKDSDKSYYCTEHGKNATHNTDNCYTLKNKKSSGNKRTFSNKNFRKEINVLLRKKSRNKVLDQYLAVINKEKAKLKAKKSKDKRQDSDFSDSDSDSDTSMAMIEQEVSQSNKRKLEEYLGPKKSYKDFEKTDEEKAYLKTVHDCDSTETSTLSEI